MILGLWLRFTGKGLRDEGLGIRVEVWGVGLVSLKVQFTSAFQSVLESFCDLQFVSLLHATPREMECEVGDIFDLLVFSRRLNTRVVYSPLAGMPPSHAPEVIVVMTETMEACPINPIVVAFIIQAIQPVLEKTLQLLSHRPSRVGDHVGGGRGNLWLKPSSIHPPSSHQGSASPRILHHRPAFNIVRPVDRSVDLLR